MFDETNSSPFDLEQDRFLGMSPYEKSLNLLESARNEERLKSRCEKTGELGIAIPICKELSNENFFHLLEDLLQFEDLDVKAIFVVNSTKEADDEVKRENSQLKKLIDYVFSTDQSFPKEVFLTSDQKKLLIECKQKLKSKIVLLDLDRQFPERDMASVRSAGSIAVGAFLKDENCPIAWIDADTRMPSNYANELITAYKNTGVESLFLQLRYEPQISDEVIARTTIDYQSKIAYSYFMTYWGRFLGKRETVGLGGPVITARASAFLRALPKLNYQLMDGKGGGEDYATSALLAENTVSGFSHVSVTTADRKRPANLGYDSADRSSGNYAGSGLEGVKGNEEQTLVTPDFELNLCAQVLEGFVDGMPDTLSFEQVGQFRDVFMNIGMDYDDFLKHLDEKIREDSMSEVWPVYEETGKLYQILSGSSDARGLKIDLTGHRKISSLKKIFAEYVHGKIDRRSNTPSEFSGETIDYLKKVLTAEEFEELIASVSQSVIKEELVVTGRQSTLKSAVHDLKSYRELVSPADKLLFHNFPFLIDVYKEDPSNFLSNVEEKFPDLFSDKNENSLKKRKALGQLRGLMQFFGKMINEEKNSSSSKKLNWIKWIQSGNKYETEENVANLRSLLWDLGGVFRYFEGIKYRANGVDSFVVYDKDNNVVGSLKIDVGKIIVVVREPNEQSINLNGFEGALKMNGYKLMEKSESSKEGNTIIEVSFDESEDG